MDIGTLTGAIVLDDQTSPVLARVDKALTNLASAFDEGGAASQRFEGSITSAATKGSFLGNILAQVTMQVISFTKNLVMGSINAGLRLEQLGVATRFLGERAGYTSAYIDKLAKDIEATGISGISTRESIQSLLGANIDLANAAKLSAIAQNMQSLSGRSSSEVFQVMTRAIATGNTELLRGVGFQNISIEAMNRQRKAQTGVTEVMTGAVRSQAILNAIMVEGEQKAGLYGVSMETAGKQAGSASRAWEQVSERIGTIVLPVTSVAMKAWYALGQSVRDSVTVAGGSVESFVKVAADGLQRVIEMTYSLTGTMVSTVTTIVKTYQGLPQIFRDVGETAAKAAIGIWAVHAALSALVAIPIIKWLGATAMAMAALSSGTVWSSAVLGTGALTKSLRFLIDQTRIFGLTVGIQSAATVALAQVIALLSVSLWAVTAAIIAAWGAWKLGNTETVKNTIAVWILSSNDAVAAFARLAGGLEWMTEEQAKSATAATAAAEASDKNAAAKALEAEAYGVLYSQIAGLSAPELATKVERLSNVLNALGKNRSDEQLKRAAEAARALQAEGAILTPQLQGIVYYLDDLKGDGAAFELDKVTGAIKRMTTSMDAAKPVIDRWKMTGWSPGFGTITAPPKNEAEEAQAAAAARGARLLAAARSHLTEVTQTLTSEQKFYLATVGDTEKMEIMVKETGLSEKAIRTYIDAKKDEASALKKSATASEQAAEKLKDKINALRGTTEEMDLLQLAFTKLTPAELANYDILKRVVPELYKLQDAGIALTAQQELAIETYAREKVSLVARQDAHLESIGVTLQSVEAMKRAGLTEADIAQQYDTTVEALGRRIVKLQELEANEIRYNSFASEAMAQQERDRKRIEDRTRAGYETLAATQAAFDKSRRREGMSTLAIQKNEIDKWANDMVTQYQSAYGTSGEHVTAFTAVVEAEAERRKEALTDEMTAMQEYLKTISLIADAFAALGQIGELGGVGKAIGGTLQMLKTGAAGYMQYFERVEKTSGKFAASQVKNFGIATALFDGNAKPAERWASGIASAAVIANGAMEAYAAGANAGSKASAAFQGAMSGAQAGAAFGPWGAAVGAAAGAVLGLIGKLNAGRKAVKEFAASFDTIAAGTGFDELRTRLLDLGAAGDELWKNLTQRVGRGDTAAAQAAIGAIQAALAALDADLQKYNLTWADMANAQVGGTKAGDALEASFKRLTGAGYTAASVVRGMSDDLNKYIIDSMRAGTKIPAAMAPIIRQLIEMRLISVDAARAMLGITDAAMSAMPSLADIKDAAGRYGIELDSLGSKVKQLEINELASQYVKDWDILTAATDDWGVLFDKMGPQVQKLITDAMKYGAELPGAMKPMIQAWIDAGQLVDENGDKLTDLSQLSFAADLEDMFESLILKLDELIDTIANGVGGALENLGGRTFRPRIIPTIIEPGEPDQPGDSGESGEPESGARHYAGGGVVYASQGTVIPFTPRGTDTVPAMLTPGERVLTVAENRAYESGGARVEVVTSDVMLDGAKVGEALTKVKRRIRRTG